MQNFIVATTKFVVAISNSFLAIANFIDASLKFALRP